MTKWPTNWLTDGFIPLFEGTFQNLAVIQTIFKIRILFYLFDWIFCDVVSIYTVSMVEEWMWIRNTGGTVLSGKFPSSGRKTCPNATFSNTKLKFESFHHCRHEVRLIHVTLCQFSLLKISNASSKLSHLIDSIQFFLIKIQSQQRSRQ